MGRGTDRRTGKPCTNHNTANGPYEEGNDKVWYCSNCGGESKRQTQRPSKEDDEWDDD